MSLFHNFGKFYVKTSTFLIGLVAALMLSLCVPNSVYALPFQEDGKSEEGGRLKFDPFIYTVIKNGKPYLRVTVTVEGVIQGGRDFAKYQNKKPLVQAAILDMLSRIAYKRLRVGKRRDTDAMALLFQKAVDRKLDEAGAVKIFVLQADQTPL